MTTYLEHKKTRQCLTEAVRVLYSRGLFSKKVVGRGTEAGKATTAADFEGSMQPLLKLNVELPKV
jgi:hypothetical protein